MSEIRTLKLQSINFRFNLNRGPQANNKHVCDDHDDHDDENEKQNLQNNDEKTILHATLAASAYKRYLTSITKPEPKVSLISAPNNTFEIKSTTHGMPQEGEETIKGEYHGVSLQALLLIRLR